MFVAIYSHVQKENPTADRISIPFTQLTTCVCVWVRTHRHPEAERFGGSRLNIFDVVSMDGLRRCAVFCRQAILKEVSDHLLCRQGQVPVNLIYLLSFSARAGQDERMNPTIVSATDLFLFFASSIENDVMNRNAISIAGEEADDEEGD